MHVCIHEYSSLLNGKKRLPFFPCWCFKVSCL